MIKVSSYLGLATFFLISCSSTCWSEQPVTELVTGKFTSVRISVGRSKSRGYVSYSYNYSLSGNIERVNKPIVRLFCLIEYKDGSYLSGTFYPWESAGDILKAVDGADKILPPYEFMKIGSQKLPEVSFASVRNRSASEKQPLKTKTINRKEDSGNILYYRLELWMNGELITEYSPPTKAALDFKKIPEDWYIYKKYSQKMEYSFERNGFR